MGESILTLTEAATQQLKSARDADQATDMALRVRVHEDGAAFRYELELVPENTRGPGDAVVDAEGYCRSACWSATFQQQGRREGCFLPQIKRSVFNNVPSASP